MRMCPESVGKQEWEYVGVRKEIGATQWECVGVCGSMWVHVGVRKETGATQAVKNHSPQ